jgi:hypothetical protein
VNQDRSLISGATSAADQVRGNADGEKVDQADEEETETTASKCLERIIEEAEEDHTAKVHNEWWGHAGLEVVGRVT